jgi:hypothetical protein
MAYFGTYQRLGVSVYATNREVIRAAYSKLIPTCRTFLWRDRRKAFLREILEHHAQARAVVLEWRL